MLRLSFAFPSGRYHATPWGRHVNEGAVEWPPSPWRISRALLATGFGRLGWTAVPEDVVALLEHLAGTAPDYLLPKAMGAHTRHYMPVYKDSPDKVIDAFAYVGRGVSAVVGVEWPVDLSEPELGALEALLSRLTYLGRAESWVDASVVDAFPEGLERCTCAGRAPGEGYDRIELLAPMPADAYASWRARQEARDRAAALSEARAKAENKGKPPPKKLTKAQQKKLEARLPATLVDAMRVDTAGLQKAGWSQPPGTRELPYWRRIDALTPTAARRRLPPAPKVDTVLLSITSDTRNGDALPPMTDVVRRAEMLHRTLVSSADGSGPVPSIVGKDARGERLAGHLHAHILPLALADDADRPVRRMDHFLVHAPMGFEDAALRALRKTQKTYAKNLPTLFLTPVGLGMARDFRPLIPAVREATVWVSATPFVPPRHLKPRGPSSLEGQVRAELATRGLPEPVSVEIEVERGSRRSHVPAAVFWALWRRRAADVVLTTTDGSKAEPPLRLSTRWRRYRRERSDEQRRPPQSVGVGLRLVFAGPVSGPLALGYACHFGLGVLVPAAEGVS